MLKRIRKFVRRIAVARQWVQTQKFMRLRSSSKAVQLVLSGALSKPGSRSPLSGCHHV